MNKKRNTNIYRSMLEEYFRGTVKGELADRIRNWIPMSKNAEETDRILRGQFEKFVMACSKPSKSTRQAWEKISAKLDFPQKKQITYLKIPSTRRWTRIAAVVIPLLIVSGVYLWFRLQPDKATEPLMTAVNYSAQISAPEDGKKRVYLPDGTEVFLNAGATLEYDSVSYTTARNVRLIGEAYFSVVKTEDITFVVDAGDITVTVLGTEFNVKTSENDGLSEVSLFSGSVEVRAKDNVTVLRPNQQVLTERDTGITLVKEFEKEVVGSWRMRLDLENVSLPKAFSLIKDHFGVPVVVEGDLSGSNSVRVSFKEPTVEEALEIVQMITRAFDYRIENDTVRIIPK